MTNVVKLSLSESIPQYKEARYWAMRMNVAVEVVHRACELEFGFRHVGGLYMRFDHYEIIRLVRRLVKMGVVQIEKVK